MIDENFIKSILPASGKELKIKEIHKINEGLTVVEVFNSVDMIMEFRSDAVYDVAKVFEVI